MNKANPWWDPVELVNGLTTKKILPEGLVPRQKRLIIKYFLEHKPEFNNVEIARLIGMSDMYVHNIKNRLLKQGAWEIDAIDVKILAVSLKKKKEELQRRALNTGDISMAWRIECDFIKEMQGLGFVYKAPEKLAIAGRLEMETETGLKRMFAEMGVLSVEQFVLTLGKARGDGNGDGNGDGRSIEGGKTIAGVLVAARKPDHTEG